MRRSISTITVNWISDKTNYFGTLTQNKYIPLLFIKMTCMNEVNDWYDFVDVQMTKINALVLWFFHIPVHSPVGFVACSDEKIAGRVHWFLSFALQQNLIQSLTSNQLNRSWTFRSALQSKNAVCAFQITYKLLSFTLEDAWRN